MASVITRCLEKEWINPPRWVKNNIVLEVLTGSIAYGMNNDLSDMDIVSVVIPPKADIFPYSVGGYVYGFSDKPQPFTVYQKHHIDDKEKNREYDITLYSIVKFFHLCMENNPNILDIIATPRRCVLHTTEIGELILKNRKLFYSKAAVPKFMGYAAAQLSKIRNKKYENSKRKELIDEMGWDVKHGAHLVRNCLEIRQLLLECDLDIERNSEILKPIRRGEWTLERLIEWFANMEREIDSLYVQSSLQVEPNEELIKRLLLNCLEIHYGNLSVAVQINPDIGIMINEFKNIIEKYETKIKK